MGFWTMLCEGRPVLGLGTYLVLRVDPLAESPRTLPRVILSSDMHRRTKGVIVKVQEQHSGDQRLKGENPRMS